MDQSMGHKFGLNKEYMLRQQGWRDGRRRYYS